MTAADFIEIHDELRAVARDVLGKDGGKEVSWSLVTQAGWTGLEIAGDLGGAGAGFREAAIICTELGRAAAASGYFGSAVLGVGALNSVANEPDRDALLSSIADGGVTVAVALLADHGDIGVDLPFTVTRQGVLNGRSDFVIDAVGADRLLLLAVGPDGAPVLAAVSGTELTVAPRPVLDESRRLATVSADGVSVAAESLWPLTGDRAVLAQRAATAIACDSLGLAEAMLSATVDFVCLRQQFGRAIGSFQAVKHACADMLVQISVSRRLVAAAVEAVSDGGPEAQRMASMAKSHTTETAVAVAGKAMQLHGGIGYTWEAGIHRYLKRATLNRALFGSPAAHRRLISAAY